jgi:hypothetical protein
MCIMVDGYQRFDCVIVHRWPSRYVCGIFSGRCVDLISRSTNTIKMLKIGSFPSKICISMINN